jgi:site-specific DNA-methyltransferase (adenine-specific)
VSHVLHCGDGIAGMAAMPERSVDHVITDPPYEAEAHTLQRRVKSSNGKHVVEAPLSFAAITEETRRIAAAHFARISRRWIVVFCQAEAVAAWRDALVAGGATYKRACVWIKRDGQPQLTGDRPAMGYESIVCAHAPEPSRWNGGGKTGLYDFFRNQYAGAHAHLHPTEKPLGLIEALISDFTDPGDLVCDPFAGSATTGAACKRLGRRFVGWEIDPGFYGVGRKRLDAAREQFQLPRMPRPRQLQLEGPEKDDAA